MKCNGSRKKSKPRCFDKDSKNPRKCPPKTSRRSFYKDTVYTGGTFETLPSEILNRIHLFNMGTETTNSNIRANQFAATSKVNLQNPTFITNMVDKMITDNCNPANYMYLPPEEFKEYLKNIYRRHGLRPISLTDVEEARINAYDTAFQVELQGINELLDAMTEEEEAEMNEFNDTHQMTEEEEAEMERIMYQFPRGLY